jgi:hypothetical protein
MSLQGPSNNRIEQTNGGLYWMTPFAAHPGCSTASATDRRYQP